MPIHTVLGPIDPLELGRTTMHEHTFIDARVWLTPGESVSASTKVTIRELGQLRWNVMALEDNLVLDDPEIALRELSDARQAGLSGFVDTTTVGIGRRPVDLVSLARQSGLQIMVGGGFYVHASHPDWLEDASVDQIATELIRELDHGIDGTGIRPAIIGEVGTSTHITPCEERVLRAVGRAAVMTGAAVSVHLDGRGTEGLRALGLITDEGVSPSRVVLGHLDEHLDLAYHRDLAAAGAVLEYDTFGAEFYWGDGNKEPSDADRMEHLAKLVEGGLAGQIVLGCDVWTKSQLRSYGGMGYEHLVSRIAPMLQSRFGIDDAAMSLMLVETPRRLLDR
jgi:phosphotriesterase-related protein